jgi:hypothetical protein
MDKWSVSQYNDTYHCMNKNIHLLYTICNSCNYYIASNFSKIFPITQSVYCYTAAKQFNGDELSFSNVLEQIPQSMIFAYDSV